MNSAGSSRSVKDMSIARVSNLSSVSQEKEIDENDLRYLAEECDYLQVCAKLRPHI